MLTENVVYRTQLGQSDLQAWPSGTIQTSDLIMLNLGFRKWGSVIKYADLGL